MKLTNLFTKTSREVPSDETSKNAQLLIRAGFIHKTMPGVYAYLPLGLKVLNKIENIVRSNLNSIGGQEIFMNSLQPKDWWVRTNRWDHEQNDVLFHLDSQTKNEYALASTHEEQISNITKMYISSWKDLPDFDLNDQQYPLSIYQIQTKFRDEIRSKAGLMRGREFRMKDLYDFHQNELSQNKYYEVSKQKYLDIYQQIGLEAYPVRASGGIFAKFSHEFQVACTAGEDWTVVWSDGERDNLEIAKGQPVDTHKQTLGQKLLRQNLSEDVKSARNHADHAGFGKDRILKTVIFTTQEENPQFVGVCIRGDLKINEELLIQTLENSKLEGKVLEEATADQMLELGGIRGRTTSIDEICSKYNKPVYWLFDKSLEGAKGMFASLYSQVDVERDCVKPVKYAFLAELQIGFVSENDSNIICKEIVRSAEVGNIFKLGQKWTKAFDIKYADENNQLQYPYMGCHGLGTSRCMGLIAELSSDDKGLKWPKSVAPFQYHLVTAINDKDELEIKNEIIQTAEKIYSHFADDCLWDNRQGLGMGQKLTDSELIGCPQIIILTKRSLQSGGVEIKDRQTGQARVVSLEELLV